MLAPVLVLVLGLFAAPPASAAVACSFDAGTGVAAITFADGDDVTIVRSGDDIRVNGSSCTGATVTTADTIHFAESASGDHLGSLTIDLSGGPFTPGKGDEGDGSSEIEFTLGDQYLIVDQLHIVGSTGDDTILVGYSWQGEGPIDLNGDEGTLDWDVLDLHAFVDAPIIVDGNEGNDELRGGGDDVPFEGGPLTLDGGIGDDLIAGGEGDDLIDGGAGTDTIAAFVQAQIDLSSGTAIGGGSTDALSGVENIVGSDSQDWLTGDDGPNRIDGGGGQWDIVIGGPGDDDLIGGDGDLDTVDLSGATSGLDIDVLNGTATGEGNDTIQGFEWIIGSPYDDHAISAPGVQFLEMGDGDDVVHPAAGGRVDGEAGIDTLDLSDATGTVAYDIEHGDLTIDGQAAAAGGFEVTIGSTFADVILGSWAGPDRIVGGRGDDVVRSWGGDDVVLGRRGRDTVYGGPGDDALFGGRGNDRLSGQRGLDTCLGGPGDDTLELCEIPKRPAE